MKKVWQKFKEFFNHIFSVSTAKKTNCAVKKKKDKNHEFSMINLWLIQDFENKNENPQRKEQNI